MSLLGGKSAEKPIDDEIRTLVATQRGAIEAKANKTFTQFTPVSYRTQVVAGTNVFVKIDIGGGRFLDVTIWRKVAPPSDVVTDVSESGGAGAGAGESKGGAAAGDEGKSLEEPLSKPDAWKKLCGMIKTTKFTMMATVCGDGHIRSRPMATSEANPDDVGTLWFFTKHHSPKMDELKANPNVNLGYVGDGQSTFISVSGRGELCLDKARMSEQWKPVYKAWFPDGLDDPEIALIKVTVAESEYWDSSSNKLVQLYGFAKALVTGQPHKGEGTDHHKITL